MRAGRVDIRFDGGFVHDAANSVVEHQQAVKFLAHEVRCSAAQDDTRAAQMSLEFIQRRLDFLSLVIERGEFFFAGAAWALRIVVTSR